MSGDFVETNRHGIFKETTKVPGGYELGEAGRVMVPEVSGEGGFGGTGEYKKYPEVLVQEYNMDKTGLKQTGEKIIEEISFIPRPPKEQDLRAPGEAISEVGEEPLSKKKKKGKTKKLREKSVEASEQPEIPVTFRGSFGEITAVYEQVFISGVNLVLVANQFTTFSYTPPVTDEAMFLTIEGKEYEAYSVGISFVMPMIEDGVQYSNKNITVLLVNEDD